MAETDQEQSTEPGKAVAPGIESIAAAEAQTSPATDSTAAPQPTSGGISWTASEFVAHEKSSAWYAQLLLATVLLAALIYLLTRDFISTTVVIIVGVIFAMSAGRQPRELEYRVDNHGITIGPKFYSFQKFRSFSIATEGAFTSINFMPLKRFAPPIAVYMAPDQEEAVVTVLSAILPMTEHRHDAVDRLMNRIHF